MHTATYCPEDNKLRLYVGRVPRPEYDALRTEGWTATPKQGCDFVATWSPARVARCLQYADLIEDEDQGPEDRAADRAERFSEYRDKRSGEAHGHADRYDSGPSAHGFQSQARADRAVSRHDRIGTRAVDAWSKAEYWQRRTAGVIGHALHVSTPAVRMGRIKELETDIRRAEKSRNEYTACFERWKACADMTDTEEQTKRALSLAYLEHGDYTHPRTGKRTYLFAHTKAEESPDPLNGAELCALWLSRHSELGEEGEWLTHYRLRLAYELQMLEAQGGRAAHVEMEIGGWLGERQIYKVNKSSATGRVVSVYVRTLTHGLDRYGNEDPKAPKFRYAKIETERLPADAYTPPTDEERAKFLDEIKSEKAAAPKAPPCPLINPTDEDAVRLVAIWNSERQAQRAADPMGKYKKDLELCEVRKMPQAFYSAHSKGAYAKAETKPLCAGGKIQEPIMWNRREKLTQTPAICEIRTTGYEPLHVIVLTDKPQKPFPASVFAAPLPVKPAAPDFALTAE